jgi:catechol 2,3-dioxygenase-like lactoylglutathione lyase family enzyme
MITGFNHTGFVINDLEAMVAFYRDTLGLTVLRERDQLPENTKHTGIPNAHRFLVFVGVPDGHHALELVHYIEPPAPEGHLTQNQQGSAHVAFNVDDLATLHADLTAKGIKFLTPPIFHESSQGGRFGIVYCQDPEGNWLEFLQGVP